MGCSPKSNKYYEVFKPPASLEKLRPVNVHANLVDGLELAQHTHGKPYPTVFGSLILRAINASATNSASAASSNGNHNRSLDSSS